MTTAEEARARITEQARKDADLHDAVTQTTKDLREIVEELDKETKDAFPPIDWRKHD
jgi:hypothetical protein